MATLKVNGSEIRALGPIKLIYNRDGSMRLTLGVEYSAAVNLFDEIELFNNDNIRLFVGRVRGPVFNEAGGIKSLEAWDWKGWMKEIPFFGSSKQQVGIQRNARVKYAYNASTATATLPIWNVGTLIQDIITNAGNPDADSLPDLWDVLPPTYKPTWNALTNFSTDSDLINIQPYGHQFDGVSVAEAINRILGKYFPAYDWWIDPSDAVPYPKLVKTYVLDGKEYTVTASSGLYLDNVSPVINNCFTRVIVEGKATAKTNSSSILPGFVDSDYPFVGSITETLSPIGDTNFYNDTKETQQGFNTEDYRVQTLSVSSKGYAGAVVSTKTYTIRSGYYGKDSRWLFDTGFDGTAHASPYNLNRTLVIIDDTVGIGVVTNDSSGLPLITDRSVIGETMADGIWKMLRDVRWIGSLLVPNSSGIINPLQRVKILNHPKFGDITFRPSTAQWDAITEEMQYSLGDSRRNPLAEMRLRNQINWRDKETQRKREPLTINSL